MSVREDIEENMAEEAIRVRYKIMNELAVDQKGTPGISLVVLLRARREAGQALLQMMDRDFESLEQVKAAQKEFARYVQMVEWTQEAIDMGYRAEEQFTAADLQTIHKDVYGWRTDEYDDSDDAAAEYE